MGFWWFAVGSCRAWGLHRSLCLRFSAHSVFRWIYSRSLAGRRSSVQASPGLLLAVILRISFDQYLGAQFGYCIRISEIFGSHWWPGCWSCRYTHGISAECWVKPKLHIGEEVSYKRKVYSCLAEELGHHTKFLKFIELFFVVGWDGKDVFSKLALISIVVRNSSSTRLNFIVAFVSRICSVCIVLFRPIVWIIRKCLRSSFLEVLSKGKEYLIEGIIVEAFFQKRKGDLYFLCERDRVHHSSFVRHL